VLVTWQIMQYKVWKLSNYTLSGTVKGQDMSMCTHGAGKRVNLFSTWYQNKSKTILCVAMMKRNCFSFQFVWNFQQALRRNMFHFSSMWLKCKRWTATYWANWQMLKKHRCFLICYQMVLWITCGYTVWWLDHEVIQRYVSVCGSRRR